MVLHRFTYPKVSLGVWRIIISYAIKIVMERISMEDVHQAEITYGYSGYKKYIWRSKHNHQVGMCIKDYSWIVRTCKILHKWDIASPRSTVTRRGFEAKGAPRKKDSVMPQSTYKDGDYQTKNRRSGQRPDLHFCWKSKSFFLCGLY